MRTQKTENYTPLQKLIDDASKVIGLRTSHSACRSHTWGSEKMWMGAVPPESGTRDDACHTGKRPAQCSRRLCLRNPAPGMVPATSGGTKDGNGHYLQANLSQPEERVGLMERARAVFGRIDILVNNVGMTRCMALQKRNRR